MRNDALRSRSTHGLSPVRGEERPKIRWHMLRIDRRNASIHEGFVRGISMSALRGSVDNFAKHQLS